MSITVSSSTIGLLHVHVSHFLLWLLAVFHCLCYPMELLHVSNCLLWLLAVSHCLSKFY